MTLNFPDSPSTGDIYTDSTSGFQYEWNGTVWISTDPQRAANIKELDDISSGFNGSTTQFNLRVSSSAVEPVSDAQILISVGGVMQNPTNDYTVSGSTITFTTAPSAGLTFFGVFLGQALSLNTIQDGTVEFASFKTGTAGVGIQSAGSQIGVGITNLNFIGTGNTFVAIGNTVNVSVNVGGIDTTGTSYFNNITASGNINVTGDLTYDEVTAVNQKISGVTTTTGLDVLGISSVKDLRSVGVTTLTSAGITNLTVSAGSTFNGNVDLGNATSDTITATGRFDSDIVPSTDNARDLGASGLEFKDLYIDGTANIDALAADSAAIGDLTSGRVTYAGSSGELQDNAGLTFDGTTLAATRLAAPVAFTTSLTAANVNVTGITTLTGNADFNGDLDVDGTTNLDVLDVDGASNFGEDVVFAGANYNITFDKSVDDLIFDDNARLAVGSGSDYQLYHDGTYTWALDGSTGGLHQQSTKFVWQSRDDSENMAIFHEDGACRFFFNGTERVSTTSVGVNVVGNVDCDSLNNAGISTFGSTTTFGDTVTIQKSGAADLQIGSTNAGGARIFLDGDSNGDFSGSDYSYIQHDTSGNLIIRANSPGTAQLLLQVGGDGDYGAMFTEGGSALLRWDNSTKIETTSVGVNITGNVDCDSLNNAGISTFVGDATFSGGAGAVSVAAGSDIRFPIGDWSGNSGTTPKIQGHSNNLYICGGSDGIIFREDATNRWKIEGSGNFEPATDSTYDIGSNSTRVRNLYADTVYGDGSNMTGVGSSLAIWQANPAVYSSDQEMSSSVVGLAYTYSNKLTAGSGSITLRETNSSGTTVQTWSTSQVTIDGNQFTADALSADLKSDQLYHVTIPAGFFTDPNGTNSVGVAYTFNTKEQIWNLFTWGRGSVPGSGGLGQNDQTDRSSPKQVPGTTWSAISQGSNTGHFLVSKNDSTLWSWGQNGWGQLGQNSTTYYSSPRQIGSDTTWSSEVKKIAKGTFLSLAIKTDGTLWAWGRNENGQLGQNNLTNYSSPKQIPGTTWRSVWTCHYSSYATKTDGTLWAWGDNSRGRLGQGNQTQYSSPKQIPGTTWNDGMGGDTAVGCTRTDGTMWVWGDDDDGTLGLGQRDQHKSSPYQLPGTTWGAIAGGYRVFWASKTDGTLWAWGQNENEQLGTGNPTNVKKSSPTQIGTSTSWRYARKDIAGGQRGGFAIKTDNTLWGWGRGAYGIAGDGTTNDRTSPKQLMGTGWRQVAKGRESAGGIQDTELT